MLSASITFSIFLFAILKVVNLKSTSSVTFSCDIKSYGYTSMGTRFYAVNFSNCIFDNFSNRIFLAIFNYFVHVKSAD